MEFVGVGLVGQNRAAIKVGEGVADGIGIVQEIQHEHVVLLGMRPVEAREGLHRLDARKGFVHVHRVQQGLVVAGLELVRTDEEAVRSLANPLGDFVGGKAVQGGLVQLGPAELVLTGEGHDGLEGALAFLEVVPDGMKILDRAVDAVRDDHCPRLAPDLPLG